MVALTQKRRLHIYQELCYNMLKRAERHAQEAKGKNEDYYHFISFSTDRAISELNFAYQHLAMPHNSRFLDVGCGIGNIMMVAQTIGFIPSGIEYSKSTIRSAIYDYIQTKPPSHSYAIFNGDAFDFTEYDRFDVIYLYCPIRHPNLESELERLVEDKMKVGAILLCNNKVDHRIDKDARFKRITHNYPIWKKVKD